MAGTLTKAQYVTCIFHTVLVWRFHFATAATIGRWLEPQKRLSRDIHSKNLQFTAIILNFQQYVVILALGTCFINRNISSVSNSNHPRLVSGHISRLSYFRSSPSNWSRSSLYFHIYISNMSSNALPRLTKREVLAVSFVPIIALLVFIFVGLIRFLLYRDRKSSRRGTSGTISPLPPPEPVLRPEEAEIENPPPPPYQPDKLPPYPTAPAPAYLRDERAES